MPYPVHNKINLTPIYMQKDKTVTISNKKLKLTNLDKIFFPDEKITKGDVIEYYNSMSNYVLPYLRNRPQSLKRNPNGILDGGFFQKDAGDDAPEWVVTEKIFAESTNKEVDYIICNNKPTLIYLANLGCIEMNPWNSRTKFLDFPDYFIIDIDPSEKNDFDDVIEVAKAVKVVLDRVQAPSFCKTSGATGMHVYVPLGAKHTYSHVRSFAELVATLVHEEVPEITTMERALKKRGKDKIYIDHLQNSRGQTLACSYSLRPRPGATVSAPLEWKEVKRGLRPSNFTIKNMARRVGQKGDLFSGILKKGIDFEKCIKALEK